MTETLTTEQVEEILRGCEGVTPGPWAVSYDELGSGPDLRLVAFLEGPDETLTGVIDEEPGSMGSPILEHIARLDPQTVSSLATELLALRKRVEWQDISTAPMDGTRILLAKIVGHPAHPTALWWAVAGHWSIRFSNWNDGAEPAGLAGPTHWMPLSTPKEPS